MGALVVVDSGIILATIAQESHSHKATALTQAWQAQSVDMCAPTLFRYEVVGVIRKWVHQGRLTAQEADEAREAALAHPIQFYIDDALLKRAYELATQFQRPTAYDSQYLAVAERLNCDLWTADERLFNVVSPTLSWVKWLNNFSSSIP